MTDRDEAEVSSKNEDELKHLVFLRDEGFELLQAYKNIGDPAKRAEVMNLARQLAKAAKGEF